jgi:glycosyltransferase involved in cell wall biosynthesis
MKSASSHKRQKELSVIVPAFNEEQSLPSLVERLTKTFKENNIDGEIIIVNDGSTDKTQEIASDLSRKFKNIMVIRHNRRKEKTAALHTGFNNASGKLLAMIDADLQYAPEDLTKLLDKINEGYDIVNGWRKNRKDSILRKMPSSFYNFVSRFSFGMKIHDFNSGLKIFKREVFEELELRIGTHRYLLNIAHHKGYRVSEVEIQHFPRKQGKSKYGASRMFWGLFDLIALRLQLAFTERPMALFGLSGIILSLLGFITGSYVLALRIVYNEPFDEHFALLLLTVLLIIAGIQTLLFGFIADQISSLKSTINNNRKWVQK